MSKNLKINDKVMVISGSHKGKTAKIVGIDRLHGKAMLDGIKVVERHMKKTQFNPAGGKNLRKRNLTKNQIRSQIRKLRKELSNGGKENGC